MRKLRILTVCAEFAPLAKVGGLGDVTAGLTRYLSAQGHEVVVALPFYGVIDRELPGLRAAPALPMRLLRVGGRGLRYSGWQLAYPPSGSTLCLIDCPDLFAGAVYSAGEPEAWRFMLLSQAALDACRSLDFRPDIVHCHDWHAAPATVLLKGAHRADPAFRQSYTVLTIHNIGYQGVFPARVLEQSDYATVRPLFPAVDLAHLQVNFLRAGITHADALTTVSPTHAREIQTPEFGKGLDALLRQRRHRLAGILNGVDYSHWHPETDPLIAARYSVDDLSGKQACRTELLRAHRLAADPATPVVGFVSRLAEQKGIDIIEHTLPRLLAERAFACVLLGSGERRYVQAMQGLAARFPGRVAFMEGHDEQVAHTIIAGSDLLMVPSLYEPCGLTQMYAMRYGTVPVVRATGGLADTVRHFDPATGQGTGSVFRDADVGGLSWGLATAFDWFADRKRWQRLVRNAMLEDFSWERQGPKYEELFARLVADA
jgi:starch synthase